MELDAFCHVLAPAGEPSVRALGKGVFLKPKISKKHKNVSAMSKKTAVCRQKIMKNSKKQPKTIKNLFIDVDLGRKGVFFALLGS